MTHCQAASIRSIPGSLASIFPLEFSWIETRLLVPDLRPNGADRGRHFRTLLNEPVLSHRLGSAATNGELTSLAGAGYCSLQLAGGNTTPMNNVAFQSNQTDMLIYAGRTAAVESAVDFA